MEGGQYEDLNALNEAKPSALMGDDQCDPAGTHGQTNLQKGKISRMSHSS